MKIKVLGASGSDIPGQHLTSFLLDGTILFDAGGVTNSLNFKEQQKIKNIFITHAHLDHIRDIPFLADNIIMSRKKLQINVLSIKEVLDDIKNHLLNYRLWPDFTVIPNEEESIIRLEKIKEKVAVTINGFKITAYKVNHTVPAVGYLVQKENKALFYTGDTGPTEQTWKSLSDIALDALIIEVSFPDKLKLIAQKTGHLTPGLLFKEVSLLKYPPKKIYLTHIKPFYRKQIEKEINKKSPYKIQILHGGEIIKI